MCGSTSLTPWFALAVSVISVSFAGAAAWTSREKLQLDLYNRRFDIYSRTLDLLHILDVWNPTASEKAAHSLQDSPELDKALKAFIKASRESQFLFDDDSGIQNQLEQMHSDAIAIIGYKRDIAPQFSGPELMTEHNKFQERLNRLHTAIPLLEGGMRKYLNFRSLYTWPWPQLPTDTLE
jgi:hypothetical protein